MRSLLLLPPCAAKAPTVSRSYLLHLQEVGTWFWRSADGGGFKGGNVEEDGYNSESYR
jgi:hypothetical protein